MAGEEPSAWAPGQALQGKSCIQDVLNVLAFGRDPAFGEIATKLQQRRCTTVDDFAAWTCGEFCALAKTSELKKQARAYQAAIETALAMGGLPIKLGFGMVFKSEQERKPSGGDYASRCTKVAPSQAFNVSKYVPDALVFSDVTDAAGDFIDDESEKLLLDKYWLSFQADPEPSLGDYLPKGMPARMAALHKKLKLKPFKPVHFGKPNEKARRVEDVYANSVFNKRFYKCPRIVLDVKHQSNFSERVSSRLTPTCGASASAVARGPRAASLAPAHPAPARAASVRRVPARPAATTRLRPSRPAIPPHCDPPPPRATGQLQHCLRGQRL